jgi:hypothetical protein
MSIPSDRSQSVIEHALQSLQDERSACVARLHAALEASGARGEIEAYLKRIESINAALIRLASSHLVH